MTELERIRRAVTAFGADPRIRLPVRGTGPLLRAPMVLGLGPAERVRVGDVVVYEHEGRRVAHRVIRLHDDVVEAASDAQPAAVERVRRDALAAKVVAVWSDATPTARRVDGLAFRFAGRLRARGHRLLLGWRRADPRRRPRHARRLLDLVTAAYEGDPAVLDAALAAGVDELQAVDRRHRCLPFVLAARPDASENVRAARRTARLEGVLATARFARALAATVAALRRAEVPFALLKGAARVSAGVPDAAAFASTDIDVLVPAAEVDRVTAHLVGCGYTHHRDDAPPEQYRRVHHHAAALFPPGGEFPVEVHHALAPPGSLTLCTDWCALEPRFTPLDGPDGPLLALDALGTALHLAIHGRDLTRLRDVVLLARALERLAPAERIELQAVVRGERRDPVRLEAALLLAARIARLDWPRSRRAERYLWWALRREDLPGPVRERCELVEALYAFPHDRRPALAALWPEWWRGLELLRAPLRLGGRVALAALIAVYVRLMPA